MAPISQLWSIFLAFGPFHSSAWVPVFPIHHSRALNKLFLRATGLQTPINEYVIRFPNDKATFEVFFFNGGSFIHSSIADGTKVFLRLHHATSKANTKRAIWTATTAEHSATVMISQTYW